MNLSREKYIDVPLDDFMNRRITYAQYRMADRVVVQGVVVKDRYTIFDKKDPRVKHIIGLWMGFVK